MKLLINLKIQASVFLHYLPDLLKGELKLRQFIAFLRRMLLFLSKLQHNKFSKMKNGTRLDLYVPTFPTSAFYTACNKFKTFGEKLPCSGVLVSVTSVCMYHCQHCYQRLDKGKDTSIDLLVNTVKKLQDMGIAFFNIEGGEPFLVFDRLKAVCDTIDDRSEIWVNSTGYGITVEKLKELHVTAIMFSLHSPDPKKFNDFMGHEDAWGKLQNGIKMCLEVGIPIAFNTCLLKDAFYDGTFEKIMEIAKNNKACIIQIIKPKPAGAWLENNVEFFSEQDLIHAKNKIQLYNLEKKYTEYPPISAQIIEEEPSVFGCTAGGTDRFYINAKGDVQPCEFLNISFGNINDNPFKDIYVKMRKCFDKPGTCMICEQASSQIHKLFQENHLTTLPLNPELSEKIYHSWDRGELTELYKKVDKYK